VKLLVRRIIAVVAGAAAYFPGLWVYTRLNWSWLPHSESDKWVVAAAFAGLVGIVVYTASAAWAEHETPPTTPPTPTSVPPQPTGQTGSGDHIEFGTVHGPAQGKGIQINNPGRDAK
jgi:hypothetical protein